MLNNIIIIFLIVAYLIGVHVMFSVDDFKTVRSRVLNCIYPISIPTIYFLKIIKREDVFWKWLKKGGK